LHDGTSREVELTGGVVLHGRFRAHDELTLPSSVQVAWRRHEPDWFLDSVRCGETVLALDEQGAFRLVSPMWVALDRAGERDVSAVPEVLVLEVLAADFDFESFEFSVGGATEFSCGDLLLRPRTPEVVLTSSSLSDRLLRGEPIGTVRGWPVEHAELMPDDRLAVYLQRSPAGPDGDTLGMPYRPRWGAVLIVLNNNLGFERGPDGTYREVSSDAYQIQLPSGVETFQFVWRGMGVEAIITETIEGRIVASFEAPASGVSWRGPRHRRPLEPGVWRIGS
jgi:hypothetical protein